MNMEGALILSWRRGPSEDTRCVSSKRLILSCVPVPLGASRGYVLLFRREMQGVVSESVFISLNIYV